MTTDVCLNIDLLTCNGKYELRKFDLCLFVHRSCQYHLASFPCNGRYDLPKVEYFIKFESVGV